MNWKKTEVKIETKTGKYLVSVRKIENKDGELNTKDTGETFNTLEDALSYTKLSFSPT